MRSSLKESSANTAKQPHIIPSHSGKGGVLIRSLRLSELFCYVWNNFVTLMSLFMKAESSSAGKRGRKAGGHPYFFS